MTIGVDRAKRDKQVRELDRYLNCILVGDVLLYIQCVSEEEVSEEVSEEVRRGREERNKEGGGKEDRCN